MTSSTLTPPEQIASSTLDVRIHHVPRTRTLPSAAELGFGRIFTDHMFAMEYEEGRGWFDARILPYGPIPIDPGASCLHYGQAMFDGCKAFRSKQGRIQLFRGRRHAARLADGAPRLGMVAPSAETIYQAMTALVHFEKDWVPSEPGTALYLRPTLVGTEGFLGVRPSKKYLFFIILSPVGAYYKDGLKPVRIWVEKDLIRAAKGGLGAVKAGANYAASLFAATEAQKRGYAQVLWLDALEHRYCEEVGVMNLFVQFKDEIVTAPLGGTILAGVTRDSVITLLRDWGYKVSERRYAFDEIVEARKNGTLGEVFGTGTAAVISPVGEFGHEGGVLKTSDDAIGPLTQRLYSSLTAIQYGEAEDPYGWVEEVTGVA
ncbi:MAG: branched-chain amino acid aminotransferase [Vicinamibacteria bacterium]|nr:branched-chain amino acid aminotransferase [Vicinamibacteria bacterium]